jgi:hypothetical protein
MVVNACLYKYVLGWGEYTPWPSTLNEYSSGDSVM